LQWILVSPYYENGTNHGTPASQDGFHSDKEMREFGEDIKSGQEEMKAMMKACLGKTKATELEANQGEL
jgi:hypothetical protein